MRRFTPILWLCCFVALNLVGSNAAQAVAVQKSKQLPFESPSELPSTKLPANLHQEIQKGSLLVSTLEGEVLLSHDIDQFYTPASIVKIITTEYAIQTLGGDFHFPTHFYLDEAQNLYIQGQGDPYLISEEIRLIAQALQARGLQEINRIYLDNTAFTVIFDVPGASKTLNPYDALNGALVVNFNSLFVGRNKKGVVYSAEKETPLTPLAKAKGMQMKKGRADRLNLTNDPAESLQYVGELFKAIFREEGLQVQERAIEKTTPSQLKPYYTHTNSRPLSEVMIGLLKYSNNYIANQTFLYMGMIKYGAPATLEKGRLAMEAYLKTRYPALASQIHLIEASGLSRENQITARAMQKVMQGFIAYEDLLSTKYGVKLKSGTMNGIKNYAGFLESPRGKLPFVMILNQKRDTRNRLLRKLKVWAAAQNKP